MKEAAGFSRSLCLPTAQWGTAAYARVQTARLPAAACGAPRQHWGAAQGPPERTCNKGAWTRQCSGGTAGVSSAAGTHAGQACARLANGGGTTRTCHAGEGPVTPAAAPLNFHPAPASAAGLRLLAGTPGVHAAPAAAPAEVARLARRREGSGSEMRAWRKGVVDGASKRCGTLRLG